jgi:type IV secretory pathway VirB9-like protein
MFGKLLSATVCLVLIMMPFPSRAEDTIDHLGSWSVIEYGRTTPTLRCMPLGACMVALEDGESISGRFMPDTARWEISVGTTGPGQRIPILAIKPKECDIASNLYVTTDRRIYTFLLEAPPCGDPTALSAANLRFDQVRFTYPEEFARLWAPELPSVSPGLLLGSRSVGELNFEYRWWAGREGLAPKVVYDDGAKTYIVLNEKDRLRDAPAVFVKGAEGELEAVDFEAPQNGGLVYVVNRVVSELVLVGGPRSTQRTTIRNRGAR